MTEDPQYKIGKVVLLAVCMTLATVAMTWLGYRSTREWLQTTRLSVEQRGQEVLALLGTALNYDLKGAQISVLVPMSQSRRNLSQPYDMADRFARAFARFPYPESFFSWEESEDPDGIVYFFNRSDRLPPWRHAYPVADLFPVMTDRDPPSMAELVLTARRRAMGDVPFAVFETEIEGAPYQILVHFIYNSVGASPRLSGLVGFTVSLRWVREHYFSDLINQISRIGGRPNSIELTIFDHLGVRVTGPGRVSTQAADQVRHFQMIFADRALLSALPPSQRLNREWTARVSIGNDPSLRAARLTTNRTLWLLALASIVTIAALAMAVRSAREAAALAAVKSAFLSSVSHEMKTPLALIRLASDTLVKGRYSSKETMEEYARMLAFEADQLTRLVDNVLSYVRIADARNQHAFEPLDITELVEESLVRFQPRLKELGFTVNLHLPTDLPFVRGDRALVRQLIENLIDNAMKYAAAGQMLVIKAWKIERLVYLEVSDRGPGIPRDEIPLVCDKFFRGRGAKERGSGLGLSIVKQVVDDHGGSLDIRSDIDHGTLITISLPASAA